MAKRPIGLLIANMPPGIRYALDGLDSIMVGTRACVDKLERLCAALDCFKTELTTQLEGMWAKPSTTYFLRSHQFTFEYVFAKMATLFVPMHHTMTRVLDGVQRHVLANKKVIYTSSSMENYTPLGTGVEVILPKVVDIKRNLEIGIDYECAPYRHLLDYSMHAVQAYEACLLVVLPCCDHCDRNARESFNTLFVSVKDCTTMLQYHRDRVDTDCGESMAELQATLKTIFNPYLQVLNAYTLEPPRLPLCEMRVLPLTVEQQEALILGSLDEPEPQPSMETRAEMQARCLESHIWKLRGKTVGDLFDSSTTKSLDDIVEQEEPRKRKAAK